MLNGGVNVKRFNKMKLLFYLFLCVLEKNCFSSSVPKYAEGCYTPGVGKYEIVIPEKITKDGSFVSHYLPHYYDIDTINDRSKRDIGDETIHFFIPIDGVRQHLELWPHRSFIAPSLIVEKRDTEAVENVNKASISKISRNQCHYNGRVVGHPDSKAALSTCYGLAGFIRFPNEEYYIEPLKDFKPSPDKEHPHVMYKRSELYAQSGYSGTNCGTRGSAKTALAERLQWESLYGKKRKEYQSEENLMNNKLLSDEETTGYLNGIKYIHRMPSSNFENRNDKLSNHVDIIHNNVCKYTPNENQINHNQDITVEKVSSNRVKRYISSEVKDDNDGASSVISDAAATMSESAVNQGYKYHGRGQYQNDEETSNKYIKANNENLNQHESSDEETDASVRYNIENGIQEATDLCKGGKCQLPNQIIPNSRSEYVGNKEIKSTNSDQNLIGTSKELLKYNIENCEEMGKKRDAKIHHESYGKTDKDKLKSSKYVNQRNSYKPDNNDNDEIKTYVTGNNKEQENAPSKDSSEIQLDSPNINGLSEVMEMVENSEDVSHNCGEILGISRLSSSKGSIGDIVYNNSTDLNAIVDNTEGSKYTTDVNGNNKKVKENEIESRGNILNTENILKNSEVRGSISENTDGENTGVSKNIDKTKSSVQTKEDNNSLSKKDTIHKTEEGNKNQNRRRSNSNICNDAQDKKYVKSNMESCSESIKRETKLKSEESSGDEKKTKLIEESNTKPETVSNDMNDISKETLSGNENKKYMNCIQNSKRATKENCKNDLKSMRTADNEHNNDKKRNKRIIHNILNDIGSDVKKPLSESERNTDSSSNKEKTLFFQKNQKLRGTLHEGDSDEGKTFSSLQDSVTFNEKGMQRIIKKRDDDNTRNNITADSNGAMQCRQLYTKLFNLELMVTVDHKVMDLHLEGDIEIFVLTIINMVATNFYDASMGINIKVALVRLIILTNCIKELDSDRYSPEELLDNFCAWQNQVNPSKDAHPNHHDLAILVTRMDSCEGQILGVTYMASVCRNDKSCIICVDEGLLLANTITHEIGHSLGAEHDDGQNDGCAESEPDGTLYHMGPNIRETSSAWSVCSREAITQFVRTEAGWCLTDDSTAHDFGFPLMLPGQIYSAAQQCSLNFHISAIPCAIGQFCDRLYCQVTDSLCASKGDPPADGTFCATDMWCFRKECISVGRRPGAINGEWGPWTEWSVCTRTCGGGVATSYRLCNNPKPSHGGRFCVGKRVRHKMCSTMPCQGFTQSFRDLQCKKTETRAFRGHLHNWFQYHSYFHNVECSLICINRKKEAVMRSPVVVDGTPCKPGTRNVCIQGSCVQVGCDWVIDSNSKEDSCGICHGNGTECRIIQGAFDEPSGEGKTILPFLRVPKGSGMVFVRETAPSYNMIAISSATSNVFYLNGGRSTPEDVLPGDIQLGTTHGVYEVRSLMERIFIRGPTKEDLIFYAVLHDINHGIRYQYAVPEYDVNYIPRYQWQYIDWDPCTDPCSGGAQRSHAKCVEDRGGVVDDIYCTENTRPADIIRSCNEFLCTPKWWVGLWSDCICAGGTSVKFRSVLCLRSRDQDNTRSEVVRESECTGKKPPSHKFCNETETITECKKRSALFGEKPQTLSVFRKYKRGSDKELVVSEENLPLNHEHSSSHGIQERLAKREKKMIKNERDTKLEAVIRKKTSGRIHRNTATKEEKSAEKHLVSVPITDSKSGVENKISGYVEDKKSKSHTKLNKKDSFKNSVKNIVEQDAVKSQSILNAAEHDKPTYPVRENGNLYSLDLMKGVLSNLDDGQKKVSNNSYNVDELCETTTVYDKTCQTFVTTTETPTTCMTTKHYKPHLKTTCCKTTVMSNVKTEETTEVRVTLPAVPKIDSLSMDHWGLHVVSVEPSVRKLPQTDGEFKSFGEPGTYSEGGEGNRTWLAGQEALDFLEKVRDNATQLPLIQHEEIIKR